MILGLRYLWFCRRATNQHGVHSPFVFDFVCSCFYTPYWKSIRFFPWRREQFSKINTLFTHQIRQYFDKQNALTQVNYSLRFIDWSTKQFPTAAPKSNDIWVFSGVHHYRNAWQESATIAPVVLDFYFWGILCFKTDQAQQSFLLRII